MSTTENTDVYTVNGKEVLVTRDPVYTNKTIYQGHYIGRQPHSYLPLAIFVTVLNPVIGPLAIIFAVMSERAYSNGDVTYALNWSNKAFLTSIITIIASVVIYTAIGFSLSTLYVKGGHSY